MKWERITSQGKLVYWRRRLDDGSYFAVTREGGSGWTWAHRGPGNETDGTKIVNISGWERTIAEAKRAVTRAVFARCPHGCGRLQWREDQWYCPRCGDEWHDESINPETDT
jgi:hypothetical protein